MAARLLSKLFLFFLFGLEVRLGAVDQALDIRVVLDDHDAPGEDAHQHARQRQMEDHRADRTDRPTDHRADGDLFG